jgi:hypothetical protein
VSSKAALIVEMHKLKNMIFSAPMEYDLNYLFHIYISLSSN